MSADATVQNFRIRRGDDWGDGITLRFYADADATPLDITGAEIWLTIRSKRVTTGNDSTAVLQITSPAVASGPGGISISDGAAGEAAPALTPAQTRLLQKRSYLYDVQVRPATGALSGKLKTSQVGEIEVLDDHTLSV